MRGPLIGRKDFHNFHWIRKINSRKGHEKLDKKKVFYLVFF
jgi:hypothetical protein